MLQWVLSSRFASALSAMMPMFMSLAWVFSVSMVVRNVVYEKEERLKEVLVSCIPASCFVDYAFVLIDCR